MDLAKPFCNYGGKVVYTCSANKYYTQDECENYSSAEDGLFCKHSCFSTEKYKNKKYRMFCERFSEV